ncbi:hypothetical protein GHK62_24060 [Sinorhizobium terangae]|uniref:Uncharacterized protein n=1 Tax=Sinorhizobium terangae TaxID=110322 RepID=A0A6N7LIK6_SINTE|nr:hypothetical protein [Sinorhizobium terangae]
MDTGSRKRHQPRAAIVSSSARRLDDKRRPLKSLAPLAGRGLLHDPLNRNRFKDKNMQQIKVLQRPLRARLDARRRCPRVKPEERGNSLGLSPLGVPHRSAPRRPEFLL